MDTKIAKLLEEPKVVGLRQVVRGVNANQIRCVLIAADADEHIRQELTNLCITNQVELKYCLSMLALGKAAGVEVGCATVGILK